MDPSLPVQLPEIDQVVVVGTGLLGASVALGLKARGFAGRIVGVGRRQGTLDAAMATGGFDAVTTDYAQALGGQRPGLVVVSVPLGMFEAVFQRIAPHDHPGLTITDAGSTKGSVLAGARQHLPDARRFIGAHPMAGSERQGPGAGDAQLFVGKPCVICAEDDSERESVRRVEGIWSALGMKLLRMSADEHDRHAATVSHLPHLAAALLVGVAQQRGGWQLASTGFRDTTRVASGNPSMWLDILRANREPVLGALDTFRDQLDALADALRRGESDAALALLERAKAHRDAWLADADPDNAKQGDDP